MKLRTFHIGGVHPEENKLTAEIPTKQADLPQEAIFPLGQHIGAPAKPVVKRGDKVKVGTVGNMYDIADILSHAGRIVRP